MLQEYWDFGIFMYIGVDLYVVCFVLLKLCMYCWFVFVFIVKVVVECDGGGVMSLDYVCFLFVKVQWFVFLFDVEVVIV